MATQPRKATGPEQDQTVEEKIQQLRELFADAPEVEDGTGERAPRADVTGVAGAATVGGKRWPGRQPSRHRLRVDLDCPARTRRSGATPRHSECSRGRRLGESPLGLYRLSEGSQRKAAQKMI